jgi:RimJ/RimL family protein N-acetyltransferase
VGVTLARPPAEWEIRPATDGAFEEMATWRYPPPFDFYDGDVEPVNNPERFFEVRDGAGRLIGFYYFEPREDEVEYGLGLRPDMAGRSFGRGFVAAGLTLADDLYRPRRVVLHVAEFNQRARRVYEATGFRVISRHVRTFDRFGDVPFLTMETRRAPAD